MNINYEDIITKANDRAEALKDFAALAEDADQYAGHLMDALMFFASLQKKAGSLDWEGQKMLGGIYGRVLSVGGCCNNLYSQLTTNQSDGSNTRQVQALVEALK